MHVPCRSRQMHVELADRVWKWLAFANEFSRFASCPFHCHPSCIAWLVFGLCFGFSIGLVVSGLLLALWIFRVPLCHFLFPAPAAPRNRLAQYLEWASPLPPVSFVISLKGLKDWKIGRRRRNPPARLKGQEKDIVEVIQRPVLQLRVLPFLKLPSRAFLRSPVCGLWKRKQDQNLLAQNSELLIRVQDLSRQLWKSRRLLLPGIRPKPWIVSTLRFQQAFGPDLHWRLSQTKLPLRWFQRKVLTSLFSVLAGSAVLFDLILRLISIISVNRSLLEGVYFTALKRRRNWKSFAKEHISQFPRSSAVQKCWGRRMWGLQVKVNLPCLCLLYLLLPLQ